MPSSGTIISITDYNTAQAKLQDILGLGEDGYGLPIISTLPLETSQVGSVEQWNRLIDDINVARVHITNTSTNTSHITTGTSIIATTVTNLLSDVDWLYNHRYTCHPSQFYSSVSTGTIVSTSTFFSNSTSTRTISWGTTVTSITHEIVVGFPARLLARYYFNLGSYLTFIPFYSGSLLNDLDGEWANFIDYLRNPANEYKYDRDKYVNYTSTVTVWTSGTLSVSVLAEKDVDERVIKFTTRYSNSNSISLYITPSGSTWTVS